MSRATRGVRRRYARRSRSPASRARRAPPTRAALCCVSRGGLVIVAVLPALDEEESIGKVVRSLGSRVDAVVVVDNGSRDRTSHVAAAHGALVVSEPRRGYGYACLAGIARARELGASVVLLL